MMRGFVFAALAAVMNAFAAQADAVPSSGRLAFDVFRNGAPLGAHVLTFTESGADLVVDVDIDLRVGLGPIPLWRYRHDVREVWRDGELLALESETRKDGRDLALEVHRADDGAGLDVRGAGFIGETSGNVSPSTYWNRALIDADAMLNTETGELMPLTAERLGVETIEAGGREIEAERFRVVAGPIPLDIWYDDAGRWVKLAFTIDGSDIEYVLAPPTSRRA